MIASVDGSTQRMAPKSLEELSRHLRRERIKLERNLSDGTDEGQQLSQEVAIQMQRRAIGDTIMEDMFACARVLKNNNKSLEESAVTSTRNHSDKEKEGSTRKNETNNGNHTTHLQLPPSASSDTNHEQSRYSESVSPCISDGANSPSKISQDQKPHNKSTSMIPSASRKLGLALARQPKQRYGKLKSMQMQSRVSANDHWLIRQSPKISGSFPDDEVSVYPDTMSVMSNDTVVRSNILAVEEVVNEEGRTCYVI
ncbi:unnamed protein product [Cylindrotheca closterium]|uniref:Uncharacterized protein n=1 Tax=Cylindrotheca closterium TaxID=2856 RepID=A0AAD2CKH2_9STRA|nr:unnamed protein product [Cylindrotheca closterium]